MNENNVHGIHFFKQEVFKPTDMGLVAYYQAKLKTVC